MFTLYDNYDLLSDENEMEARENLRLNEIPDTDANIMEEIYATDTINFEETMHELCNALTGPVIFFGAVQRWDGTFQGGKICNDFESGFYAAAKDCEYFHIYDDNGHLFIKCSHHDGTNLFEVKEISEKGMIFADNWNYSDAEKYNYSESEMHTRLIKNNSLSRLPHIARRVYGWKG